MHPDLDDIDDEIRGHIALSVKERTDRGEDSESARYAALREFGNVTLTRESIESVWRPQWVEQLTALWQDLRVALRSLRYARGLAVTVGVTLALGIGANAAIFSVVRQVLLRPLVNDDEERLLYIRQSAPGLGAANTAFSMPEIDDLRSRVSTITAFGDFSTIDFTLNGFGEPRVVRAGVVSGSYFDVMGLRPALGRLLAGSDDGPDASGAVVLTHRFWSSVLENDPTVIGRTIRLDTRTATVVGVLEPSVPYPTETEIIANVVTSPHHLGATMVTSRTHRMTELFGRLAPGATLEEAHADLAKAHAAMMREHPDAYEPQANMQVSVSRLRDQITAPARPVLLVLLAAAAVVFAIACSNVANLILARSVRRERELAVRAALGAGAGALRRTLLAESLVLCATGAVLGLIIARPLVALIGRFTARFSARAMEVTVDASLLWVGAGLAMVAAVVLAYIPRLPSLDRPAGFTPASHGIRMTPSTGRRLRTFAVAQVALSFVLLAGAATIVVALVALQRVTPGYDMRRVLALDVPQPLEASAQTVRFFDEATRRIRKLPGVERVAVGSFVPWRDVSGLLPTIRVAAVEDMPPGSDTPHARLRTVTPGYFATLGMHLLAGREFTDDDQHGRELVVIASESVARHLFPNGDAVGRRLWWSDPISGTRIPRRVVGVVADVDDQNVVPQPAPTLYHPIRQIPYGGRLFVRAAGDPYALVQPLTRLIQRMSPDQPVERPATLADVRQEVLAPERLNALVLSAFAGVALLIAVVGVAGVLAFSVSARTREFGVRLALGSTRRHLMTQVLSQGALIAAIGIVAGAAGVYVLGGVAATYIKDVPLPGVWPLLGASGMLAGAAIAASLMPAARASRVDVIQALQSE
jgi:predicted permease